MFSAWLRCAWILGARNRSGWRLAPINKRQRSNWSQLPLGLLSAIVILTFAPKFAHAEDFRPPGIELQEDEAGKPVDKKQGLNAKDLYKLLDQAIGDTKFASTILIFGGCFTGDFSDEAKNSKIATNKTAGPVAVFAASGGPDQNGETNRWEKCPEFAGANPFMTGVMNSLAANNAAKPAGDAGTGSMTTAVKTYNEQWTDDIKSGKRKSATASHPKIVFFHGGEDVTLAGKTPGKGKKYAIIVMGAPKTYVEWNEFVEEYQQLVDAGYDPENIQAFFGTGKKIDQVPSLVTGVSVEADEKSRRETGESKKEGTPVNHVINKDGKAVADVYLKIKPATFRKLRAAFKIWKTVAKDGDEFFFKAAGHFINRTDQRDEKELDLTKDLAQIIPQRVPPITPRRAMRPLPGAPPQPTSEGELVIWTGGYLGLEFTASCSHVTTSEFNADTGDLTNQFHDGCTGYGVGINGGYNWLGRSNLLVGAVFDATLPNDRVNHPFAGGTFIGSTVNFTASAQARVAFLVTPSSLVYGQAGVSLGNQRLQINFGGPITDQNQVTPGFTLGGGGEWMISRAPFGAFGRAPALFVEYQHTWWADAKLNQPAASPLFNYVWRRESDVVKSGVRVRF